MFDQPDSQAAQLCQAIIDHYDLEELRTLCSELSIDYDSLRGEGKAAKARELVAYCERKGRIDELRQRIAPSLVAIGKSRGKGAHPFNPLPESAASPFIAGPKIEDPALFVGRACELRYLTQHATGAQPVSVNVVGERRIGKSSLLYHFYQTWAQPQRYAVVYLSLQSAACQRQADFYAAVFAALRASPAARANAQLAAPLKKKTPDGRIFDSAIKTWKANGVLPVLCLDEFEALFEHPAEFDNGFYDSLRALMDGNVLMLIAASHEPLDVYRRQKHLTSSFFNVGHQLPLRGLTEAEAAELVSRGGALSLEEQRTARKWGGAHPYLLQLACSLLWQARHAGQPLEWAQEQFDREKARLPRPRFSAPTLLAPLRWLSRIAACVGGAATSLGALYDDVTNRIIGAAIIIVIFLVVLGVLGRAEIAQLLSQLLR
jgi:hypothetical protein